MASNTQVMTLEQTVLRYIKMNNNNTENASDDVNTVLSIAPMYDSNSSNGNGGNQNVFNLTGNIQVIEDNHIDQNTQKIMFVRCLTSWFGWCIKFLKNLLILNPSKGKTQGTWVF